MDNIKATVICDENDLIEDVFVDNCPIYGKEKSFCVKDYGTSLCGNFRQASEKSVCCGYGDSSMYRKFHKMKVVK